jgi:hypothetical protein
MRNVRELKDKHRTDGGNWFNEPFITLQIEADAKDSREVKKGLYKAFNQKGSRPYGLNFRFVPNKSICLLSADSIAKLQKMWIKHQADVKELRATTTEDIIHLDRPYKSHGTLRELISELKHSKNKSRLFHSVDKSQSWMDETGMTTIMMAFTENQDEAESMVQLLPAIVEHDINAECAQEWFTSDAYDRACEIQYDTESNTFISPDDKMMDYLLADELQGNQVEMEGMTDMLVTNETAKPRGSDQSFISFGYALGKTKEATNPQTPGNDSTSSPTDTSQLTEIAKLNEEQKTMISKLQAEVDNLKLLHPPSNTGVSGETENPVEHGKPQVKLSDSESDKQSIDNEDAADSDGSGKTA